MCSSANALVANLVPTDTVPTARDLVANPLGYSAYCSSIRRFFSIVSTLMPNPSVPTALVPTALVLTALLSVSLMPSL